MWIVVRSNDTTEEHLMLDSGTFRECSQGMAYPFQSPIDAMHRLNEWEKAEPWWDYEIREIFR